MFTEMNIYYHRYRRKAYDVAVFNNIRSTYYWKKSEFNLEHIFFMSLNVSLIGLTSA